MPNNNGRGNGLYFIIGALAVAVVVLGYMGATGKFSDDPDFSIEVSDKGIDVNTD